MYIYIYIYIYYIYIYIYIYISADSSCFTICELISELKLNENL